MAGGKQKGERAARAKQKGRVRHTQTPTQITTLTTQNSHTTESKQTTPTDTGHKTGTKQLQNSLRQGLKIGRLAFSLRQRRRA